MKLLLYTTNSTIGLNTTSLVIEYISIQNEDLTILLCLSDVKSGKLYISGIPIAVANCYFQYLEM